MLSQVVGTIRLTLVITALRYLHAILSENPFSNSSSFKAAPYKAVICSA